MLVDDEPDILTVFKMGLERCHARVETYLRPYPALDAFTNCPGTYDLIIVDVRMSEMDGIEFAKKICAIRSEQPILFASAFDYDHIQLKSPTPHIQASEFLKKPVSVSALLDVVQRLLCSSGSVKLDR